MPVPEVSGINKNLPYGAIANAWKRGQIIPFLGAGASLIGLPSGYQIATHLADLSGFPSEDSNERGDLAKVSSYYADISGRSQLRSELREMLNLDVQPAPVHRYLASIDAPQLIVVTNYDDLIERAFRAVQKPYDVVVYPSDRPESAGSVFWWKHGERDPVTVRAGKLVIDLANTNVIFKMHGTLVPEAAEWDSFVITEEDYMEFLSRMTERVSSAIPPIFYEHFRNRGFLFMGYSLRDWNLRVILWNLSKRRTGVQSWAIQKQVSELDRYLWSKRNVSIFESLLDDFIVKLQEQK